jgi:hypothetical protein
MKSKHRQEEELAASYGNTSVLLSLFCFAEEAITLVPLALSHYLRSLWNGYTEMLKLT